MNPILIILCVLGGTGLLLLIPWKGARSFTLDFPEKRIHEEEVVLSRRLLVPGTGDYDSFYKRHAQYRLSDDLSRKMPGLLDDRARYFHTGTFAASRANFDLLEFLGTRAGNQSSWKAKPAADARESTREMDPEKASRFISAWLRRTGAHSVGFTRLKAYHLYSHKGRGPGSGLPIHQNHPYAIALTVEMDHRMMQSAPMGTSLMESSEQYLRSGILALKLAAWIRELGYEATAHIDGNYEVICPLVAVDAGLGTIGRMGLLMTPRLGPRVRISVVTTNMPVTMKEIRPERTTLHFCHLCKKCAAVCPAAAIPDGPRKSVDGKERWQINSEKCYHFWTVSGTDCGRCVIACPYSHPDKPVHRFVRWGIKNNLLFRYLALKLDDLYYGREPAIRALPEWSELKDSS